MEKGHVSASTSAKQQYVVVVVAVVVAAAVVVMCLEHRTQTEPGSCKREWSTVSRTLHVVPEPNHLLSSF